MKKIIIIPFFIAVFLLLMSCDITTDNQESYNYKMETLYAGDDKNMSIFHNFQYYDNILYGIVNTFEEENDDGSFEIVTIDLSSGEKTVYFDKDQAKELGTIDDLAFDRNGDIWLISYLDSYIFSKMNDGRIQTQISAELPLTTDGYNGQATFTIDNSDLFYVNFGSSQVYVLNAAGEKIAEIPSDTMIGDFISLEDEMFVLYSGDTACSLALVNIDEKKLDSVAILAQGMAFSSITPADMIGGQYCYYDLNGINMLDSKGNITSLLSWTDYGLSSMYPSRIFATNEGDILCCNWNEIIKMKRVAADEGDQRQILTLAAFSPGDPLKAMVADFNRTNEDYMVSIIDYDLYNTDSDQYAGLNKLNTEIVGGNPPDMIDMRYLDAEQYINKGLLEDLYPYIDGDAEFERTDFLENVLDAMGDGDHLYGLTTTFRINTVLAKTAEADLPNWNLAGLGEVVQTNPEIILGGTKTGFLELACTYMQDNFVDWEENTASFDTPAFIAFLEACNTLPDETEIVEIYDLLFGDFEDRSVYSGANISDFSTVKSYEDIWGTEVSLIGYPETGSTIGLRMYVGITAQSGQKNACWTFLRTALLSGMQEANAEWMTGFPISKSSFEKVKAQATVPIEDQYEEYIINGGDPSADPYELEPPTEAQVNKVADVATTIDQRSSNNTVIKDIVLEEAEFYFDGSKSAEKVAEVIQNRVRTYMNEQK